MGVPGTFRYQPRNGASRNGSRTLYCHLKIKSIGKTPHNLTDVISGQGL
jgi:hypothetical protein